METIESRLFGRLEFEPKQKIRLPAGLPGLAATREVLPVSQRVIEPFVFFQSIQEPNVCILSIPVLVLKQDYELVLSSEDREVLGFGPDEPVELGKNAGVFAFVSVEEERNPVANLLAPLVVRLGANLAVQAVQPLGEEFLRFPLPVWVAGRVEC